MGDLSRRHSIEVVDVDNRRAEAIAILRYYLASAERGELVGLMVIAETARGGYSARETRMTGTDNVAERVGRLVMLIDDVKDAAEEEPDIITRLD
jgi:hypothetical protein